jgi:hypothetical protein
MCDGQDFDLCTRLSELSGLAISLDQYGAAYHALAAGIQCCDDPDLLESMAMTAAETGLWLDKNHPEHRLATHPGHTSIFASLSRSALNRSRMIDNIRVWGTGGGSSHAGRRGE